VERRHPPFNYHKGIGPNASCGNGERKDIHTYQSVAGKKGGEEKKKEDDFPPKQSTGEKLRLDSGREGKKKKGREKEISSRFG